MVDGEVVTSLEHFIRVNVFSSVTERARLLDGPAKKFWAWGVRQGDEAEDALQTITIFPSVASNNESGLSDGQWTAFYLKNSASKAASWSPIEAKGRPRKLEMGLTS